MDIQTWLSAQAEYDLLLQRMQLKQRFDFTIVDFVAEHITDAVDCGFADDIEEVY